MKDPNEITPEIAEKILRAVLDPSGIAEMGADDPFPLTAKLYNAGYLAGATKADEVVTQIMQVTPDTSDEQAKSLRGLAAAYLLDHLEQGTLDKVKDRAILEAGFPPDEATQAAVLEVGAPEWNEAFGDKYRDGHMAGYLDFLEECLIKVLKGSV